MHLDVEVRSYDMSVDVTKDLVLDVRLQYVS